MYLCTYVPNNNKIVERCKTCELHHFSFVSFARRFGYVHADNVCMVSVSSPITASAMIYTPMNDVSLHNLSCEHSHTRAQMWLLDVNVNV